MAGWRVLILEPPWRQSLTDSVAIDADRLKQLNDQLWRRLGITQTFDRLLVEAAAVQPGETESVRDFAGRNLSEGATRFWQLSFPQIKKDLCRKTILADAAGVLSLSEGFAERVARLLDDIEAGVSRVEPTPGVTLEDLQAKAKAREDRDQAEKAAARSRTRKTASKKTKDDGDATPKTRKKKAAAAAPVEPPSPPPVDDSDPGDVDATKVFTTKRINALLDRLDAGALLKTQLGAKLDLGGAALEHFLVVTGQMEVTRFTREDMVELHFKGREFAATSGIDRRQTVRDLTKQTRELSGELI